MQLNVFRMKISFNRLIYLTQLIFLQIMSQLNMNPTILQIVRKHK